MPYLELTKDINPRDTIKRDELISSLADILTGEYLKGDIEITGVTHDPKTSEIFLHIDIWDKYPGFFYEKTIKLSLAAPIEIGDYCYENKTFKVESTI